MSDSSPPVTIVTGASRGLGRGIALHLASKGHSVAINYAQNEGAAAETVSACEAAAINGSQRFIALKADVASAANREKLVHETLSQLGRIDALVNNAGIAPRTRADITDATEASFEEIVRTNLQGPYFLTQAVVRHWLSARPSPAIPGGFKVVFVTSISANTASVMRGDYCISKAGLAMAAQLWAVRLAAENIQVVEIRPGIMATDMTANVRAKYDDVIATGTVPQRRWGTADDVGLAVAAVLRGDFPFSTGAVIPVDGGFQLRQL